jgi:uroporphyrinogen-III decarboxylase
MNVQQWEKLLKVINGEILNEKPVGFIIDSPWLPNWYGITILDYLTNDDLWFKANMKAIETFPQVMFLPGFWSEYGMCGEPSAFGVKSSFPVNSFPYPYKNIYSVEEIGRIQKPDPEKDGFCPFMLNRLKLNKQRIEDAGHNIRFSVSRGPLNIASYLMGTTEFLTAMMTNPEEIHTLLQVITDFLGEWHDLQKQTFSTIDGILVLDDIIGFIGEEDFKEFGLPYFKKIFAREVKVKFLHNDADCMSSVKYLPGIGVNLFNMGFETELNELKRLTENKVTMLGNIPPRDVLANGSEEDVEKSVRDLISGLMDRSRVILSCGGGIPPEVTTENINSFINAASS